MNQDDLTTESACELRARCEALPRMLKELGELEMPQVEVRRGDRIWVTGAGLAEGPARMLAAQWRAQLGLCAEFVPLTAFVSSSPEEIDLLVVCSQGLSPNAQLALPSCGQVERALLITSARLGEPDSPLIARWLEQGGEVWDLPPECEDGGFLLRVQGPTLYTLAIACWVSAQREAFGLPERSWQRELEQVPGAYKASFERALEARSAGAHRMLSSPHLALLSYGSGDDLSHGLRWKILEGMWRQAPPVFDALQIVHGPWQGFYDQPTALLALIDERCKAQRALTDRLGAMLKPHHRLEVLTAKLSAPLGYFEFAAQLDAMVILENERLGRDLTAWPGRGDDGPLYQVSTRSQLSAEASSSATEPHAREQEA